MGNVLLLLASCAVFVSSSAWTTETKNPYEDNEGARLMRAALAYEGCLQGQAEKLDDGVSDAGTIGEQVWDACRWDGYRLAGAYWNLPGMAYGEKFAIWVGMFTKGKDAGTTRVLRVRSERRK